jgi:glucose-6-phosphate 1-dehydrogenase
VLFGASGDLAVKMLWPAGYRLEEAGERDGMPVIGVAASVVDERLTRASLSICSCLQSVT